MKSDLTTDVTVMLNFKNETYICYNIMNMEKKNHKDGNETYQHMRKIFLFVYEIIAFDLYYIVK